MFIRSFWVLGALLVFSSTASAEQAAAMTLSFSWAGTAACARDAVSPVLMLRNVPRATATFSVSLASSTGRELGGGVVPYTGGDIEAGAIKTRGPCQTTTYTWTVEARDPSGLVLATAERGEHFPD